MKQTNSAILRELTMTELDEVTGGALTIDMGWCAAKIGIEDGILIVAGSVGNYAGAAWVNLPNPHK